MPSRPVKSEAALHPCRCHQRGVIMRFIEAAGSLQHLLLFLPDCPCCECFIHPSIASSLMQTFTCTHRHHHRGAIMIVTEAAGGLQRMQHDVPILADFPCCEVPTKPADSRYPPLQWQQRAAKVAVHRIAASGCWLQVTLPTHLSHHIAYSGLRHSLLHTPADSCWKTFGRHLHA